MKNNSKNIMKSKTLKYRLKFYNAGDWIELVQAQTHYWIKLILINSKYYQTKSVVFTTNIF